LCLVGLVALPFGVVFIAFAVYVFIRTKPRWVLSLRTSSGDQEVFQSFDRELVVRIKSWIEEAVVARNS
jgi:hypothetical protein